MFMLAAIIMAVLAVSGILQACTGLLYILLGSGMLGARLVRKQDEGDRLIEYWSKQ